MAVDLHSWFLTSLGCSMTDHCACPVLARAVWGSPVLSPAPHKNNVDSCAVSRGADMAKSNSHLKTKAQTEKNKPKHKISRRVVSPTHPASQDGMKVKRWQRQKDWMSGRVGRRCDCFFFSLMQILLCVSVRVWLGHLTSLSTCVQNLYISKIN